MGSLIRTLLVLAIVLIGGAYLLGYLPNTAAIFSPGKASTTAVERERPGSTPAASAGAAASAAASDVKTRAVEAAQRMDDTLADTALTTKIKAKIALDDTVKSADVSVHTKDGVVTIAGTAPTAAIKARVMSLAHETNGVKSIVDQVTAPPAKP